MYAIVHHQDYDEVLLGPVEWKPRFIASVIQQDLDLPNAPSISVANEVNVPYEIYPSVWAYKVNTVYPDINTKIQRVDGPFWTFENQVATATYTAADKSVDQVKGELKNVVATKRYELENAGTTVTVQGVTVPVSTSRADRATYTTAIAGPWKFSNGTWLTLTQEDLNTILTAIQTYVSNAFIWEQTLCATIDAATDLTTLNSIEI